MDSTTTCPTCGATLTVKPDASEIICEFCGTHIKVTPAEGEPQLSPTPPPEMAAPDLSEFSPEAGPETGASSPEEPLPPPSPPYSEPYPPATPEPPVVENIPAGPPVEPPVTPVLPGQPPKRSNTTTWIIVTVVVVVVICLCIACAVIAFLTPVIRNSFSSMGLALLATSI